MTSTLPARCFLNLAVIIISVNVGNCKFIYTSLLGTEYDYGFLNEIICEQQIKNEMMNIDGHRLT